MRKYPYIISAILIFAGLFVLIWQFVFIPIQNEILSMQNETRRLQKIEQELAENYENIEELAEITHEEFVSAKKYLPSKNGQEEFISEIYRIAENNKIAVNRLQVGETDFVDSDKKLCKQSIKIRLEGGYADILNFMREIYDGERFATVENIVIEKLREDILSSDMEIYIYFTVGEL